MQKCGEYGVRNIWFRGKIRSIFYLDLNCSEAAAGDDDEKSNT